MKDTRLVHHIHHDIKLRILGKSEIHELTMLCLYGMGITSGTNTYLGPMPGKGAKLEPKTTLITEIKNLGSSQLPKSSTRYFSISNNRLLLPVKSLSHPKRHLRLDQIGLSSWQAREHACRGGSLTESEKPLKQGEDSDTKKQGTVRPSANNVCFFLNLGHIMCQSMEIFGGSLCKQQSDEHRTKWAKGLGRKPKLTALEVDPAVSLYLQYIWLPRRSCLEMMREVSASSYYWGFEFTCIHSQVALSLLYGSGTHKENECYNKSKLCSLLDMKTQLGQKASVSFKGGRRLKLQKGAPKMWEHNITHLLSLLSWI